MPSVGDVLAGRYRVEARLGSGGMATVFRARDLRLDRDVAIKVLLPNMALDPAVAARFDLEARALASAAHPSVVSVFDVEPGDPDGREPFYVMELCEGGSLADRLATDGRLPPAETAAIIDSIAAGLADLHRRGVIHRDVKPHNILFSGGRAKLADFGLARGGAPGEITDLTAAGTMVGTLAWLAPELLEGRPASAASDTYALAVVAFQCLTGRLPAAAASVREVVELSRRPAPRVSDVAPELGVAFDGAMAAGLSTDPAARPEPTAFADALRAAADRPVLHTGPTDVDPFADTITSLSIPAMPVETARPARPRRSQPSRPNLVALGLAGLAVVGLMLAAAASRQPGRDGLGPTASPAAPSATPASPATSPSASPPTPSPTPVQSPSPTPDPAAAALAALDRVDAAIADLGGPGGLKNRDLNDLRRRAAELRLELENGQFEAAAGDANRLAAKVDDLEKEADRELINALQSAVAELIRTIPSS